jgi:hypothetical protein
MAHPGEDVGAVLLNVHTATTAEALLSPPQLPVDKLKIDVEASRQSRYKGDKALAV